MRCVDCQNFKEQEISEEEAIMRYGDNDGVLWRKRLDSRGKVKVVRCLRSLLPREYYIDGNLNKLKPENCQFYDGD